MKAIVVVLSITLALTTLPQKQTSSVVGHINQPKPVQAPKIVEVVEAKAEAPKAPEPAPTPVSTNCEELGNRLLGLGVTQSDIQYALFIANKESGCRSSAVNKSSGACGEFQSLPCGKWGTPGTDQYLLKAIGYAQSRYGGWQGAHTAWVTKHWW